MAEWPTADDVKRRVGIKSSSPEIDADVQSALDAAIEVVRADCTYEPAGAEPVLTFTDTDELRPARIREAALLLAVSSYKAPDAPHGVAGIFDTAAIYVAREHPQYAIWLRGFRGQTGIA